LFHKKDSPDYPCGQFIISERATQTAIVKPECRWFSIEWYQTSTATIRMNDTIRKIWFVRHVVSLLQSYWQNQFWFDHNWFLGMHGNYLYTLPFAFKHLNHFTDFDHFRSSDDEFLNNNPRM
jgi:hypothetical protein